MRSALTTDVGVRDNDGVFSPEQCCKNYVMGRQVWRENVHIFENLRNLFASAASTEQRAFEVMAPLLGITTDQLVRLKRGRCWLGEEKQNAIRLLVEKQKEQDEFAGVVCDSILNHLRSLGDLPEDEKKRIDSELRKGDGASEAEQLTDGVYDAVVMPKGLEIPVATKLEGSDPTVRVAGVPILDGWNFSAEFEIGVGLRDIRMTRPPVSPPEQGS